MSVSATPSRPVLVVRLAIISAALLVMWVGPCLSQIVGVPRVPVRTWRMFWGKSLEVCATRFVERTADGNEVELDRFELLGYASRQAAPKGLRHQYHRSDVERTARQLCEALGDGHDVRVYRRCADARKGWKEIDKATRNYCVDTAPAEKPPKEKPKRFERRGKARGAPVAAPADPGEGGAP